MEKVENGVFVSLHYKEPFKTEKCSIPAKGAIPLKCKWAQGS